MWTIEFVNCVADALVDLAKSENKWAHLEFFAENLRKDASINLNRAGRQAQKYNIRFQFGIR